MFKTIGKLTFFCVLVAASAGGIYYYTYHHSADYRIDQLEQKNHELEQQKEQLRQVIGRLKTERRIARFVITDQKPVNAVLKTTLLFMEYRRDGSSLPPRQFIVDGDEIHFDAEVVKFNDQYVEANDPLRGQPILLMLRLYGADQAPSAGFPIDQPGSIPDIYRGSDPAAPQFEQQIWNNFWKLFNDRAARETQGIRGLHGEGLWGRFELGHEYTIDLRPDGGSIHEEPLDPMYRAAITAHPGV